MQPNRTIIDTHAHLDHLENLDDALKNAVEAGVEAIVAVSMDLDSCRRNLEIKQKTRQPYIALGMGMHPSEANLNDLKPCISLIRQHATDLSAIGEIGLDFWYKWVRKDDVKKKEQMEVFETFLNTAKELNLPVSIHSRGAWRECFEMAKDININKAVFHWYSGPLDVLGDILRQGFYVSASPSLAYSEQSRNAISYAPIEQTLIETDCPVYYEASTAPGNPRTNEGFKAEPRDCFRVLKAYCELKKIDEEKAILILNKNAREVFGFNKIHV